MLNESPALLRQIDAATQLPVPPTPEAFLRELGGPTLIRVRGRDGSRARAASTLLHGNEPSGLRAMHAWLRSGIVPAVDTLLVIASVDAALAAPGFAYRMLPGSADLNRCFLGPFEGAEGELAAAILSALRKARPEALIDLHNNTGHNPPYGVGPDAGPACLNLVSLFGERFVHSLLRLGSLVEATQADFPSVTIEAGRAGDARADAIATEGLERYLGLERLQTDVLADPRMQVLVDPVRVRVRAGVELAFGEQASDGADFTVREDIDRHNFEPLASGLPIGWLGPRAVWPLEAIDGRGLDVSRHFFVADDQGRIVARRELVPIMMTTHREIALADCLFYVVDSVY